MLRFLQPEAGEEHGRVLRRTRFFDRDPDRGWSDPEGMTMENEVLIIAIFVGTGLLAYVIMPGLLVFRAEGEDEKPSGFGGLSPAGTKLEKNKVLRLNRVPQGRDWRRTKFFA
jgi:hypothetical protein